jgi:ABC-2 type transport system ATP-binding protein
MLDSPRIRPARPLPMTANASSSCPAVAVAGAVKRFGTKTAVAGIDLEIAQGSLCGILGPNGAGKSTTIRMIMAIIHPDEGSVEVLGGSAMAAKDRIGYLPEERGLYRKMRVGEFLVYAGRLKGLPSRTARERARRWLGRVELPDAFGRRCEELSKGMQQKVQFVASVLHEPDLLILDEPFSGLDPVNARLLTGLLLEIHAAGTTILFSTHLMHTAEALCERIVLFSRGRTILDDSLAAIRRRFDPRTIAVEPLPGDAAAAARLRAIPLVESVRPLGAGGGLELHLRDQADPQAVMREVLAATPARSIALRQASLEEVFVGLVGERPGPDGDPAPAGGVSP